jgi:hypothetical protein
MKTTGEPTTNDFGKNQSKPSARKFRRPRQTFEKLNLVADLFWANHSPLEQELSAPDY